jgi:zinc transport system ATP-binding protein
MLVAVELKDVAFAYPRAAPSLQGVNVVIEPGEFLAIAGPNGGGKTTLLRVALGILHPQVGFARLFGEPAVSFDQRERIGYLAQRAQLGTNAPVTVREVVTAGRAPRLGLFRPQRRHDRRVVERAMERVGLSDQADAELSTLSGGQQQRAFMAKALAGEPDLLVLDEPTAGVDADAQESFAALLAELHHDLGVTILFVSHEFGAVEQFVERLVLVRGGITFDGKPKSLPPHWHDPSHVHL